MMVPFAVLGASAVASSRVALETDASYGVTKHWRLVGEKTVLLVAAKPDNVVTLGRPHVEAALDSKSAAFGLSLESRV